MRKSIIEILTDTLKVRNKWSMKRMTAFVVMNFVLALGAYIVLSDILLEKEVNKYATSVFDSFLLFEAALMGISEIGKKVEDKVRDDEQTEA